LAERFRDQLGYRSGMIGASQLSALNNHARSAPTFEKLKEFVAHQAEKAEKADKPKIKEYWTELKSKLIELENEAQNLAVEAGLPVPSKEGKPKQMREAMNWLYLWLGQEYIQHLVAHSLFIMPKRNSGDHHEHNA